MAKVKSFVMDMEEEFYGGAQDVVHECSTFEQFVELMMTYRDQVSHQSDATVKDILGEIYYA